MTAIRMRAIAIFHFQFVDCTDFQRSAGASPAGPATSPGVMAIGVQIAAEAAFGCVGLEAWSLRVER